MKNVFPAITIAFDSLGANKFRSALSMLGVIIGVSAVIATVAARSGATECTQEQIASALRRTGHARRRAGGVRQHELGRLHPRDHTRISGHP